jgi:hypothetical protein
MLILIAEAGGVLGVSMLTEASCPPRASFPKQLEWALRVACHCVKFKHELRYLVVLLVVK